MLAAYDIWPKFSAFWLDKTRMGAVDNKVLVMDDIVALTRGRPVLCIDDDPSQLVLLSRFLSLAGYSTTIASNGQEGLESLRANRPCLVLLDLDMGEMDGISFLAHLRNSARVDSVPVILQTAHATRDNIKQSMDLGIQSAIIKPITRDDLLEKVQAVLQMDTTAPPAVHDAVSEPIAQHEAAMGSADLEQFLDQTEKAGAMAHSVIELQKITSDESAKIADIVDVVHNDTVLGATIIRLANTVEHYKGNSRSLNEAVTALGASRVGEIATQLGVVELLGADPDSGCGSQALWEHSLLVANLCERLARRTALCLPEEAMLAGLLHDVGLALVAQFKPDLSAALRRYRSRGHYRQQEDETATLGWRLAEISEMALHRFKLSDHISSAVGHHGDGPEGLKALESDVSRLACLIQACDAMAHAVLSDPLEQFPIIQACTGLDQLYEQYGLDQDAICKEVASARAEVRTLVQAYGAESSASPLTPKQLGSVAIVRPDQCPPSPLAILINHTAKKYQRFSSLGEVTSDWTRIIIDVPPSRPKFAEDCASELSNGASMPCPVHMFVTADIRVQLEQALGQLTCTTTTTPCYVREIHQLL
jgi:HD-like signal output (HDOD) protein/FixJ family two-component response regulator